MGVGAAWSTSLADNGRTGCTRSGDWGTRGEFNNDFNPCCTRSPKPMLRGGVRGDGSGILAGDGVPLTGTFITDAEDEVATSFPCATTPCGEATRGVEVPDLGRRAGITVALSSSDDEVDDVPSLARLLPARASAEDLPITE